MKMTDSNFSESPQKPQNDDENQNENESTDEDSKSLRYIGSSTVSFNRILTQLMFHQDKTRKSGQ